MSGRRLISQMKSKRNVSYFIHLNFNKKSVFFQNIFFLYGKQEF